jgi:drug/metabolite transporter (DMT)-like permease
LAIALGLVVALSYGTADFLGGVASRRVPAPTAVLASQTVGLLVSGAAAVVLSGGAEVTTRDIALGIAAGVAAIVGLACLYQGLAVGRTSVVAPVSAVGGAALQVGWGLTQGEEPGAVALVGTALALVAVAIVAGGTSGADTEVHADSPRAGRATELLYAAGAAVGLGAVLILFSETGDDSGLWPVVVARAAPLPVLAGVLALSGAPVLVPRDVVRSVAAAGVLDATANALLLVAVRDDLVSIVAPVAALYPASTVVLARLVFHERVGRTRLVGIAVAFTGLVLIAVR